MARVFAAGAALLASAAGAAAGPEPIDLSILYLGNARSERSDAFATFLESRFTRVRCTDRASFDPATAGAADVVLLDWSQSDLQATGGNFAELRSPLGPRETWSKPTVLLGSAGLLLSAPWQTAGSFG
jgi:hypothetical protein